MTTLLQRGGKARPSPAHLHQSGRSRQDFSAADSSGVPDNPVAGNSFSPLSKGEGTEYLHRPPSGSVRPRTLVTHRPPRSQLLALGQSQGPFSSV